MPMIIDSLFLTAFEDHRGQSLLWQKDTKGRLLDGIEFASLPSGLHLVDNDTFYFTHAYPAASSEIDHIPSLAASSSQDRSGVQRRPPRQRQMALAVYKNREMTPEEVEKGMVAGIVGGGAGESSSSQAGVDARGRRKGRGRIMMSLGVVMAASESRSFPPSQSQLDELRTLLSHCSREWDLSIAISTADPDDNTAQEQQQESLIKRRLEEFWERCSSDLGSGQDARDRTSGAKSEGVAAAHKEDLGRSLSNEHPIRYLPRLIEIFGPNLVTLWKYALAGKRILFYSQPPLYPASQIAWLVALFSTLPPRSGHTDDNDDVDDHDVDDHDVDEWDIVSHNYLISSVLEPLQTSWSAPTSSSASSSASSSEYRGCIGLMDLDSLHQRDGDGGWIACTSDRVFWDKSSLWDLFVDLSAAAAAATGANGGGDITLPDPGNHLDSDSRREDLATRRNRAPPPPMFVSATTSSASGREASGSHRKSPPQPRSITHTYSDRILFGALSSASPSSSSSAASGKQAAQGVSDWLPLYLSGAAMVDINPYLLWNRMREACWGICQYATGANLLLMSNDDDQDDQEFGAQERHRHMHRHRHRGHGDSRRIKAKGQSVGDSRVGGIKLDGPEDERSLATAAREREEEGSRDANDEEDKGIAIERRRRHSAEDGQEPPPPDDSMGLDHASVMLDVLANRAREVIDGLKLILTTKRVRRTSGSSDGSPSRAEQNGDGNDNDQEDEETDKLLTSAIKPAQAPMPALTSAEIRSLGLNPWSTGDVAFANQLAKRLSGC